MLLVILGIVWIAVLAYWFNTRTSSGNSLGGLTDRLGSLERVLGHRTGSTNVVPLHNLPHAVRGPMASGGGLTNSGPLKGGIAQRLPQARQMSRNGVSSAQARVRRRNVLFGLLGLAFVTLLMGITARGTWMTLHLVVDAAVVGYLGMVLGYQREMDRAKNNTALRVDVPLLHDDSLIIQPEPDVSWDTGVVAPAVNTAMGASAASLLFDQSATYPQTHPEPVAMPLAATGTEGASVYAQPEDNIWSVASGT